MDAIEKIVEQIFAKGQAEIAAFEEAEKRRIIDNNEVQQEAVLIQEATQLKKNEEKAKKAFKQRKNRQQLEIRQGTLNKKQQHLEALFVEATLRMNNWSAEEFQAFFKQSIAQLPIEGEAFITVGELSKESITPQWLLENQPNHLKLLLKNETIAAQGGFIIGQDGVEYNFLFASLVQEIQKQESFTIAGMLFK